MEGSISDMHIRFFHFDLDSKRDSIEDVFEDVCVVK